MSKSVKTCLWSQIIYGNWADDEPTSDDEIAALLPDPYDASDFQEDLDKLSCRLDAGSLLWLEGSIYTVQGSSGYVCRRKMNGM